MIFNCDRGIVTGRQRVMREKNQRRLGRAAQGEQPERDTLFEWTMRLLQGFDFEVKAQLHGVQRLWGCGDSMGRDRSLRG